MVVVEYSNNLYITETFHLIGSLSVVLTQYNSYIYLLPFCYMHLGTDFFRVINITHGRTFSIHNIQHTYTQRTCIQTNTGKLAPNHHGGIIVTTSNQACARRMLANFLLNFVRNDPKMLTTDWTDGERSTALRLRVAQLRGPSEMDGWMAKVLLGHDGAAEFETLTSPDRGTGRRGAKYYSCLLCAETSIEVYCPFIELEYINIRQCCDSWCRVGTGLAGIPNTDAWLD